MAVAGIDGKHSKTSTVTLTDMALGCNLRILSFHWSGYTCSETGPLSCAGEIFLNTSIYIGVVGVDNNGQLAFLTKLIT